MSEAFQIVKKNVENGTVRRELDCLKTVVLNISERCQLHCDACPRGHGYQYGGAPFMSLHTAREIADRLYEAKFKGTVSISGMGEPCLHPHLIEILRLFNGYRVHLLTNGLVKRDDYGRFPKNVLVMVSLHNEKNFSKIRENLGALGNVPVRNHDTKSESCELIQTNRGGWLEREPVGGICAFPFYKTLIDIDGSYLLCADDWRRCSREQDVNVFHLSLEEYFCGRLTGVKHELIDHGRAFAPCDACSANGKLMGMEKVEWYKKHVYRAGESERNLS